MRKGGWRERLRTVSEVWRQAEYRGTEFDATAVAYDRHRPRYPSALFADLALNYGVGTGDSKDAVETDSRFMTLGQRRYRFDRKLDAHTFVQLTKTYGGRLDGDLLAEIEALINTEFGGTVTKVEEAAVYSYRRL